MRKSAQLRRKKETDKKKTITGKGIIRKGITRKRASKVIVRKTARKRTTPKGVIIVMGLALLVVVIAVLIINGSLRNYLERYNDGTILPGITIDGVDVSRMTSNQALAKLRSRLVRYQDNHINFTIDNQERFGGRLEDVGLGIQDLESVVARAVSFGEERSLIRRASLQRQANRGQLSRDFPLNYEISLEELRDFLEINMEAHLNIPANARIESYSNGVRVIPDQIGEVFDFERTYQELSDYINNYWDRGNATLDLTVIQVEANITADQLEEITDLLGTFTTTFIDSTPNRAQNVENGASRINHLLIPPGGEVSACAMMRPYTEENGYAYGAMIAGNTFVEAIGGGICQVSSTLYNALLYAEMDILQRNAHTMTVPYVFYSRDAAIAEGIMDLRFRNNMSTPIYIEAVIVPGESITYNIFGREARPQNREIRFFAHVDYGEAPQGAQFIASEYGIGAMWLMSEARAPITARLYKIIYIDGEEVERLHINSSYYLEAPRIWSVGTASPNPDSAALIRGAIASQNYETIRNTINQILSGGNPAPSFADNVNVDTDPEEYVPSYSEGY